MTMAMTLGTGKAIYKEASCQTIALFFISKSAGQIAQAWTHFM